MGGYMRMLYEWYNIMRERKTKWCAERVSSSDTSVHYCTALQYIHMKCNRRMYRGSQRWESI